MFVNPMQKYNKLLRLNLSYYNFVWKWGFFLFVRPDLLCRGFKINVHTLMGGFFGFSNLYQETHMNN